MSTGRGIEWIDGIPRPIGVKIRTPESQNALACAAATVRYRPIRVHQEYCDMYAATHKGLRLDCFCPYAAGEEQYEGKSCDEVAWMKRHQLAAEGDYDSHKFAHEAIAGKAKQQTDINQNVTINLSEWAAKVLQSEKDNPYQPLGITVDAVDTEVLQNQMIADLEGI